MKVSILCLADRPKRLPVLVWSIIAQTYTDWELYILDQSADGQDADEYLHLPEEMTEKVWIIKVDHVGDWGQTVKEMAARDYAIGDALIFPNDDAYYVPTALEEMVGRLKLGCDIAVCGWLYDFMGYVPMPPSTREGRIDVGGFMVKTDLFRKVGWANKSQTGDAKLVQALVEAGGVVGTCNGTLYVKN